MTNVEAGKRIGAGPANEFSHARTFPPADFRDVVRPNFDTLYSVAWLDLTKEPMVVTAPDTEGRYYMLPMLDMWTDVFAVPGKRTIGTNAGNFAVVPPSWKGQLPRGVEKIEAPTLISDLSAGPKPMGQRITTPCMRYRTATTSLRSRVGQGGEAREGENRPLSGYEDAAARSGQQHACGQVFRLRCRIVESQSAACHRLVQVARLKRIGIEPGKSFDLEKADPAVQRALEKASIDGLAYMKGKSPTLARVANGWQMNTDTMGVYGDYYLKRAIVAM